MPKRIMVNDETLAMIEHAKTQLRGWKGQHKRIPDAEALDWLLQDTREYGSPVVKGFARKVYGPLPGECEHGWPLEKVCAACKYREKVNGGPLAPETTP